MPLLPCTPLWHGKRTNLPSFSRDTAAPVCPLFAHQVATNILFVKETNLYFCSPKEATTNLSFKTVSTARRYEIRPGINTVSVGGLSHQWFSANGSPSGPTAMPDGMPAAGQRGGRAAAVDRQVDRTCEWRGSGGETALSQIPGTVVYCNTGWVVYPAGVSAVQRPCMASSVGTLGLERRILTFVRVNAGLGTCQRPNGCCIDITLTFWRRNYFFF